MNQGSAGSIPALSIAPMREPGKMAPALAAAFCCACLASIPYAMTITGPAMIALAVAGLGCLLVARFAEQERWRRLVLWPVALILGVYAVCIVAHGSPVTSVRRSASMPFFSILFLAVQIAAWRPACLRVVLFGCGLVAVSMSMDIGWQWLSGRSLIRGVPHPTGTDLPGSQGNRNDMAAAALFMPLALAAWPAAWRGWPQGVLSVMTAPVWILSRSRQAAVGWVVAAAVTALRLGRSARAMLPLALAAIGTLVVALAMPGLRQRMLETLSRGLGEREEIMAFGIRLFLEHPLLGISPGTFGEHYATAVGTGWTWRGRQLPAVGMPWTHSLPIEIAAEFGLVGLVGFGLAAHFAWGGAISLLRCPDPACRLGRGLAAALAAGMLVGLVDLTFIKDWFRIWFWIVLGVAAVGKVGAEPRV